MTSILAAVLCAAGPATVYDATLGEAENVLEKDKTAVLLDARGTSELPGAKGLLLVDIKKAKDDGRLPMLDHNTRILVVGANAAQARALAEAVAKEAFNNVAFFGGDPAQLRGAPEGARTADK
jgi:rhodanese-related sulfurtransferase